MDSSKLKYTLILFCKDVVEIIFDHVRYQNTRLDRTRTATSWTNFAGNDIHLRPDTLPRYLHQTKLR